MTSRADLIEPVIARSDGSHPTARLSKHLKMAQSPFVFYRGSAALYYRDLADGTIALPDALCKLPLTGIMGDCHASNFGFLTEEGSHGDTVIFAPNDFDDACVAYPQWDLMRFAVSLHLVCDHCVGARDKRYNLDTINSGKPVISLKEVHSALHAFFDAYVGVCNEVSKDPSTLYQALDTPPPGKLEKPYKKAVRRAAGGDDFTVKSALAKAVHMHNDVLAFRHIEDKFVPLPTSQYSTLHEAFSPYMDDTIVDIVSRQSAGTGSLNLARYYFLVGPAKPHNEDSFAYCHIVEVKQQREAAPLAFFKALCPVNRLNPAHLTARCQRRMQRRPDLLLDEVVWNNKHWLIRSRHHAKVGLDPEDIGIGNKAVNGGFSLFGSWCGRALGLAHCRGDRRSTRFARRVSEVLPACLPALMDVSERYAQQVIDDHRWFVRALRNH